MSKRKTSIRPALRSGKTETGSEAHYRALFNSIAEGFCLMELCFDAGGKIRDLIFREQNPAFDRHTGLGNVVGKSASEVLPNLEHDWMLVFEKVARSGEPVFYENYVRDIDRWFTTNFIRVGGPGSTLVAVAFRDISARKKAESILRQSEQKRRTRLETHVSEKTAALHTNQKLLQAVMDATTDMVQVFEAVRDQRGEIVDFRWVFLNHEAERWMPGATGHSLLERQPGVVAEGIFDAFKRVVETGIPDRNERHYVHEQFDGWFFQSVVKLADGVATTTTDITARKEAEQQVRQNEALLSSALSNTASSIMMLRPIRNIRGRVIDFEYVYTNEELLKSVNRYSLSGKHMLEEFPGVGGTALFRHYVTVAETGREWTGETHVDYDGFDVWAQVYARRTDENVLVTYFDITARKSAEQQLRESKDLLQTVFDVSVNPIAYHKAVRDASGKIIDFKFQLENREAGKYSVDDRSGRLYSEAYPGITDTEVFAMYCDVVETGLELNTEVRLSLKGIERWFHLTGAKLGDGLVATALDITDRVAAREQIVRLKEKIAEEATDKYYSIFNAIDEGFCIYELVYDDTGKPADLRWIEVNPAYEKQTGLKDVVGRLQSAVLSGMEDYWLQIYHRVASTGIGERQVRFMEADQHWYDFYVSPVKGNNQRVAVVFQDITERKQREEAVRRSEERLRRVLDGMGEGFGLLAPDFTILEHNREALRMDGRPREEIVGRSHWEAYPDSESSELGKILKKAMAERVPVSLEHQYAWEDDHALWLEMRAYPTDDGSLAVFWRDVTERRNAEEALHESEEKFSTLFETMDEGFTIIELERDEDGKLSDMIYLEANLAFQKQTGLANPVGKRTSELMPNLEASIKDMIQRAADTGEPQRAETFKTDLNRWFDVVYIRVGGAGSRNVAALFKDITQRKRHELNQSFLVEMTDDLQRLDGPEEITQALGSRVGGFLGISSCLFVDTDDERNEVTVHHGWEKDGVPTVKQQTFCLSDYVTEEFARACRAGETTVVCDTANDRRTAAEAYASLKMRAFLAVPFHREGRWVSQLVLFNEVSREWRDDEIELAKNIADRVFPRIERARAEEALRSSQKRIESIANLVPDLLWESEPDGYTDWYNQRWMEYTGQSFEEATGWGWTDAIHPDDREGSARRYAETVRDRKALRQEHRIRRHDGAYRWFVVSALPFIGVDGQVVKMYGAATDIHDRKQTEDALRESEEKFRTLFNSVDEGYLMAEVFFDEVGKPADILFIQANPAAIRIAGRDFSNLRMREIDPQYENYWYEVYGKVALSGEAVRSERYVEQHKKWFEFNISRVGQENRHVAAVFQDITERKQREQYQHFLVEFSDALREEKGADAIADRAIGMIAGYLQLDRCYVGISLFDENREIFPYQVGNELVPALPENGVRLSDFPGALRKTFKETLVVADFQAAEGLTKKEKQNFTALGFGALVIANVREKENKPHWSLNAVSAAPRNWTPMEIQIIKEATERIWAAMERARAEDALRRSEAKFRRLSDSGLVAVSFFDIGGPITEANDAFMEMFGITRGELESGKVRWDAYTPEEWMPRTLEAIGEFKRTGHITPYEKQYFHNSGVRRWGIFAGATLEGGDIGVSLVLDITDRKNAEDALYKSQAHLSATFNALPVGVSVVDATGKTMLYNQAMKRFLPEGVIPSRDAAVATRWKFFNPDGSPVVPDDYPTARALRGEAVVPGMEFLFRQEDGTEIWTLVSSVPVRRQGGRVMEALSLVTDIDALKRTAEALRRSEEKFRTVFEAIDEGFALMELVRDAKGKVADFIYREVNESFVSFTGWQDAVGKSGRALMPHLDKSILAIMQRVADTGTAHRKEDYVEDLDRWYDVHYTCIGDPGSNFIVAVFNDVTARKQNERRQNYLLKLNDALRSISDPVEVERTACRLLATELNAGRAFYCEISKSGNYLRIAHDYHVEDMPSLSGIYPLADYAWALPHYAKGEPIVIVDVYEGGLMPASWFPALESAGVRSYMLAPLIKDTIPTGALGVSESFPRKWKAHETTLLAETAERIWASVERAKAEQALRSREARTRKIIETDAVSVLFFNHDGVLLDANGIFMEASGWTREDIDSGTITWETMTPPEWIDGCREQLQLLNTTGRIMPYEKELFYKDGRRSWVLLTARDLRDGTIVEFAVDISDRKRVEAALRESELQYRTQLEIEVHERTTEITALNRMLVSNNRELESLHSELTTFNHVVSNDYKATIQALYLYLENIMKAEAVKLSDSGKSNVRKAQGAIQKLNLLTDDIVAFSKLHHLELDFSKVGLQAVFDGALQDLEGKITETGARISMDGKLPEIDGYPLLLSLLFHHLLDNAIKFMPPGKRPEIVIRCRKIKADNPSGALGPEYHEVIFEDNGIGFPQKEARNLFRIFYRLHEKRDYRGSGVGLAVCKKIMDIHQGSIKAVGNPGNGSAFSCCFPLAM